MSPARARIPLIRILLTATAWLALGTTVWADETVTPTTPPPAVVNTVDHYHLESLNIITPLSGDPVILVRVVAVAPDGGCAKTDGSCRVLDYQWRGERAEKIINNLLTANLTNNSLRKRILTKLLNDGVLPEGTIVGTAGIPIITTTSTTSAPTTTTAP